MFSSSPSRFRARVTVSIDVSVRARVRVRSRVGVRVVWLFALAHSSTHQVRVWMRRKGEDEG